MDTDVVEVSLSISVIIPIVPFLVWGGTLQVSFWSLSTLPVVLDTPAFLSRETRCSRFTVYIFHPSFRPKYCSGEPGILSLGNGTYGPQSACWMNERTKHLEWCSWENFRVHSGWDGQEGKAGALNLYLIPIPGEPIRNHLITFTPFPQLLHLEKKGGTPPISSHIALPVFGIFFRKVFEVREPLEGWGHLCSIDPRLCPAMLCLATRCDMT